MSSTPTENGKTNALVLASAGIALPTKEQIDKLAATADEKRVALAQLLLDNEISDSVKERIQLLVELAQPQRPGMEEYNQRWDVPRVNICQPTTQASAKPESAKPGDLYSTAGSLLERPFHFIPIYFHEENLLFRVGEKAPECKAIDAKIGSPYGLCTACPHLPFGKQNGGQGEQKQTDCFSQLVVTVLTVDLGMVFDIPFAKTSRTAGNALAALARAQSFPWKQSYMLDTEKKTGEKGVYHVARIVPVGKDNTAEAIKIGRVFSELYGANRKKTLADNYLAIGSARQVAVQAEKEFRRGVIDVGEDAGEEPDVSAPAATSTPSKVRGGKPM
jgi:hypothetical protein